MIVAAHSVLATGGCGRVFEPTSNPMLATDDGVAIGLLTEAAVQGLEFFQFNQRA